MQARFLSLVVLGFASAALAALVPGVFDPASSAAPVRLAETAPIAMPETAPAPKLVLPPAVPVIPAAAQPRRSVVPTGCERLVSPLARSAASSTASRCIT